MEGPQNLTNGVMPTDNNAQAVNDKQQAWIDYCAVQGMITEVDGEIKRMTITDFANRLNIRRETLYDWRSRIPNFWDRVKQRRMEIGTQARTNKVYNGLYLRAAKGDAEQVKIWLSIFDNYQPPSQKHEVTIGGLGDLVNEARKKKIIEGETVEPDSGNNA